MSTLTDETATRKQQSYLVYLLVSLIFLLLFVPVFEHSSFATSLLRIGLTAVLISAAVATQRRRTLLILGLFVAGVAAPLSWMTMFIDQPLLFLVSCLLESTFFVVMAVMILITVMQKHLATVHSIFGAISGYLLIGLAFAVLYWGLDHIDPAALNFANRITSTAVVDDKPSETAAFSQFVYFSFVTMSTLGYGDIAPRTSVAQTFAWMQSVIGQFYLAVLVAWLISEIPRRGTSD